MHGSSRLEQVHRCSPSLSSYIPFGSFSLDSQRPRYPLFLLIIPFIATASNTFYHHFSHDPLFPDVASRISYPFGDDLTRLRSYSGMEERNDVYTGFVVPKFVGRLLVFRTNSCCRFRTKILINIRNIEETDRRRPKEISNAFRFNLIRFNSLPSLISFHARKREEEKRSRKDTRSRYNIDKERPRVAV